MKGAETTALATGTDDGQVRVQKHPHADRKRRGWKQKILSNFLTFRNIHIIVLVSVAIVGALLIWAIERNKSRVSFLDALFNSVSAVSCTGLITSDLSTWRKGSYVILTLVAEVGSVCLSTCIAVPLLRGLRAKSLADRRREHFASFEAPTPGGEHDQGPEGDSERETGPEAEQMKREEAKKKLLERSMSWSGVVTDTAGAGTPGSTVSYGTFGSVQQPQPKKKAPNFMGLSFDYEMEHAASRKLVVITACYSIALQMLGFFALVMYATWNSKLSRTVNERHTNKWFWSLMTASAAFTNTGFLFWTDGLSEFSSDPGVMVICCLLIVAGNTCVPIFIRFIVWMARNISQRSLPKSEQSLRYILKNPTRLSTHLFSSAHTRILMCVYVFLWMVVTVAFVGNSSSWSNGRFWVQGLFIAIASRTAGFYLVDLTVMSHDFLLLIIGSMWIAAYPIAVIRRQAEAVMKSKLLRRPHSKINVLYKYWKSAIFTSITWLYVVIVIISYCELRATRPLMTDFGIIFEIASAYGTVGYSLSNEMVTSLSGAMSPISKLCVMFVMILGRHRGLPSHVYHKDMRRGVTQEVDLGDLGV